MIRFEYLDNLIQFGFNYFNFMFGPSNKIRNKLISEIIPNLIQFRLRTVFISLQPPLELNTHKTRDMCIFISHFDKH